MNAFDINAVKIFIFFNFFLLNKLILKDHSQNSFHYDEIYIFPFYIQQLSFYTVQLTLSNSGIIK